MRILLIGCVGLLATLSALPACADGMDDANEAVTAANRGDYANATQLFTQALESGDLEPAMEAQGLSYRGIAELTAGDVDAAERDLNAAVDRNTSYNADAYANRGYFAMVLGEPLQASADLVMSAELRVWPYNTMWLFLSRLKAHIADVGMYSLANNIQTFDAGKWPGPLLQYFLGRATRDNVIAEAARGTAETVTSRRCDADFYLTEYDLAHGKTTGAREAMQRAADHCPFGAFERLGARLELARLPE